MSPSLLAGCFVASIIPGLWVSCYFYFVIPCPVALFFAFGCGKFEYEFAGWLRQYNYDYDLVRGYSGDNESIQDTEGTEVRAALDPMDEEEIDMMYTGHFIFGCTLPNAAINGAEPLKMIIKLGGNELTYHIRK